MQSASTFIPNALMGVLEEDHDIMGSLLEAKPWMKTQHCIRYEWRHCGELADALVRKAAREFRPEVREQLRALARAVEHVEEGRL